MKAALLGGLLCLVAGQALGHRLDEYLQATRVSVSTNAVELSFELTPGVAVATQVLALLDPDRDGRISDDEGDAYAERFLEDLQLRLDEKILPVTLVSISFPPPHEIKGGVGIIRIKAASTVGPLTAGRKILSLTNTHLPMISVYLVNALVPNDPVIKIAKQTRDELQRDYRLEFAVMPPAL